MRNFLNFKDAVIIDASQILPDQLEIFHPLHDLLLLLESSLDGARVDLLLEDELEVIAGVVLPIAQEV